MKKVTIFLLILNQICSASWASSVSSHLPELYKRETSYIPRLLNDILSGPLKGRSCTLMTISGWENDQPPFDELVREIETPLSILRLPGDFPAAELSANQSAAVRNPLAHGDQGDGVPRLPLEQTVLVFIYTCEDVLPWPFWNPPAYWSAVGILIISTCPSCYGVDILEYPLLEKASSLSFICPDGSRKGISSGPEYRVQTWLPFTPRSKGLDLGFWDPLIFESWNDLFVDRFRDMSELTMSICANDIDIPFVYAIPGDAVEGISYQIQGYMQEWLHFQQEYIFSDLLNYTSITSSVKNGETDVMINFITATPERYRDFQITVPYAYAGFGVMLRIPPPLPRWKNIYRTFSGDVWVAIVIMLLSTVITFHRLYHNKERALSVNTMTVIKALLLSPLAKVPTEWRIRWFLLLWWISAWLLTVSYACNLIAILTVPLFQGKIRTLQELAKSPNRLCMFDYGEFVPEALQTSNHPTLSALGKKLDLVPIVPEFPDKGLEACVELVLARTHAQTEAYPYIETLYSRYGHSSDVYTLEELLYPSHLVFLITKNAPWKYKFDAGLLRLNEFGLIKKWYQETMDKFVDDSKKNVDSSFEPQPLSMDYLQGSFYLYVIGISIAILMLATECLFSPGVC